MRCPRDEAWRTKIYYTLGREAAAGSGGGGGIERDSPPDADQKCFGKRRVGRTKMIKSTEDESKVEKRKEKARWW